MGKTISLYINSKNDNRYALMLNKTDAGTSFEKFINIPNDYTNIEFIDMICSLNPSTIILDTNGKGIYLDNLLKTKFIDKIKNPRVVHTKHDKLPLSIYNKKLLEFALESQLNVLQKIEFHKLAIELNNFEHEVNQGVLKFKKKNDEIGSMRAICFMQYLNESSFVF